MGRSLDRWGRNAFLLASAPRKRAKRRKRTMSKKRIGLLFGMEDTFPWALVNEINTRAAAAGEEIEAVPVQVGHVRQEDGLGYDVILDRISHEVPFYRTI